MASQPIVAITGPPGVGKTTLVRALVERLQQRGTVRGFLTEEVREQGARSGFDVVTLTGQRATLASVNASSRGGRKLPMVGRYSVDVAAFELLAVPLLKQQSTGAEVLVIDEVGKMELLSKAFSSAVSDCLGGASPLLVTIPTPGRGKPLPLVERIRSHPKVLLITVTKGNRSEPAMQERIVAALTAHW